MISFRYHLVTIVAVFLALALGVLAGTTVIKSGLVKTLRDNTNRAERQLQDAQRLNSELGAVRDDTYDWLVPNRLAGQDVVVLTDDKADPAGARNAAEALSTAGANVTQMTATSLLTTKSEAGTLADLLCLSRDTPQATLVGAASTQLADRLANGAPVVPPTTCPTAPDDLLVSMIQQGFLTSPNVNPGDAGGIGGPAQLMVVSAGGQGPPGVPTQTFMRPIVDRLVADGATTAAVETKGTQLHPFVPLVRSEPNLSRDHLITVDNVEQKEGREALVLGLARMVAGAPGGDYGTKAGADQPVPPPP
jgi:hypothetical protein